MVDLPSIVAEGGCWTPEYAGGAWGATAEGGAAEDEEAILSGVAERSSAAAVAATAGTETVKEKSGGSRSKIWMDELH